MKRVQRVEANEFRVLLVEMTFEDEEARLGEKDAISLRLTVMRTHTHTRWWPCGCLMQNLLIAFPLWYKNPGHKINDVDVTHIHVKSFGKYFFYSVHLHYVVLTLCSRSLSWGRGDEEERRGGMFCKWTWNIYSSRLHTNILCRNSLFWVTLDLSEPIWMQMAV